MPAPRAAAADPVEVGRAMERLLKHLDATSQSFASLMRPGVVTQPVPFFGDITKAAIVTVGVNPSAGEFELHRGWPSERMSSTALVERLLRYFDEGSDHHEWFEGWGQALRPLGIPYPRGGAHLDLSPRATRSFGAFTRGPTANRALHRLFLEMVAADLPHFGMFLDLCGSARLVLLAGGVTNHRMYSFLGKHLGPARIRFPYGKRDKLAMRVQICVGERWTPGLIVSVGPSERGNWSVLAERLAANRHYLLSAFQAQ